MALIKFCSLPHKREKKTVGCVVLTCLKDREIVEGVVDDVGMVGELFVAGLLQLRSVALSPRCL